MKRFTWGKSIFFSFLCVAVAQADIKMSGQAEAGILFGAPTGGTSGFDFLVDHANMNIDATVSDKTSVHVSKGFAFAPLTFIGGNGVTGVNLVTSTATYFNKRGLLASAVGSGLTFAINTAYLQHKCASFLTTQLGMTQTPFGMEGMWGRHDYLHYAYSRGYDAAVANGWNYDLGVLFNFEGDNVPGKLEVAIQDGSVASQIGRRADTPAVAARWHMKLDAGSVSITPVASVYANSFGNGGPHDFGFSGGANIDAGMFALNAEFIQTNTTAVITTPITKTRSIWFEPQVDFGVAKLTGKVDLGQVAGVNDTNIGVGISKEYDDHRVRLLWSYNNMSGLLGAKTMDFRLLFGTKF